MSTIYEIAKELGVSTATVSRALNNKGYVRKELKQRILATAEELGYVPNSLAKSLASGLTKVICLIVPDLANVFFALVARGVEDIAYDHGYSLIICNTDGLEDKERKYVRIARERKADGIIFIGSLMSRSYLTELVEAGIPMVIADRYVDGLHVDMVINDNLKGAKAAVNHLIRLGHQAIATIRGPQNTQTAVDRYLGYVEAMHEHFLDIRPEWVRDGDYKERSGYVQTQRLLALKERPTAIFAANDLMALGALTAIEEAGLRVPQDLAVVGYDDIPLAAQVRPRLTTVAQPKYELGQQAMERLIWRLNNAEVEKKAEIIVLQPRLVVRESSLAGSIRSVQSVQGR